MARTETAVVSVQSTLQQLQRARQAYRDAVAAVEEHGEQQLIEVADALDRAEELLHRYEGDATGTGDFQAYVTFQGKFAELVEGLSEDLPGRDAFEAANEVVDQRRLSESDFERARAALDPVREFTGRLQTREAAAEDLDDARRAATDRLAELEERIDECERLRQFADVDLDAPTDAVREPVEAYDDAVREAFDAFCHDEPAREVLRVIDETRQFPLVDFETPPDDLARYLQQSPAGEEPIPTLLRYDDYSASKLDHYVPDAGRFRSRVSTHRSYLDRLSADPLVVGWPPPAAGVLRARAGELVSVTAKFAPERVVARARQLYRIGRRDDYERLRTAARAETELSETERDRLQSGAVETELDELRDAHERLSDALDDTVDD
jgi:hypothetical protein